MGWWVGLMVVYMMQPIVLMGRVFANGPGNRGSIMKREPSVRLQSRSLALTYVSVPMCACI